MPQNSDLDIPIINVSALVSETGDPHEVAAKIEIKYCLYLDYLT